jgi:ribosome biogenesis GTPase
MLDRYLVACEAAFLPALIVANKVDLASETDLEILDTYREIGYDVLPTSAVTGQGLETLRQALDDRLSVLTGPSGSGKSTILNRLWPDLDLRVGQISDYHDRGRHTTVVARLLIPAPGVYVADTPGLRQFRFWDIDPEQLEGFFPEMLPHLQDCRFSPCSHMHEPGCAVRHAVETDNISSVRYESYRRMFEHGF